MFSVYFHIPFCRKACHYCDFHFSTQLGSVEAMVEAMERELAVRAAGWQAMGSPGTVYFGGGTPSVLHPDHIARLLGAVRHHFPDGVWEEVTLEANPDDLTEERLAGWRAAGVDRLSVGVQTFDDALLGWMGRTHTGDEAEAAVRRAGEAGFKRMTLDLMYGLPGRDLAGWARDLERALALPVNHLSAYVLTVEPRTALGVRVARGLEREAPEEAVEAAYRHLCAEAEVRGWAHYEVSNFAAAGGEAVHNARYWEGVPYLGIGPGAHGFTGQIRYANRPNNPLYLKAIQSGDALPEDRETLTRTDRYNEQLMTGLRTARGIDLHALETAFGMRPDRAEAAAWEAAVERGDLVETGGRWRIPEPRWLVGDAIAAELFKLAD